MTTLSEPVKVTEDWTLYDQPAQWTAFPGDHDVYDVSSEALLTREGDTITLKMYSQSIRLTPDQASELANILVRKRQSERCGQMLALFASRAPASR